MSTRSRKNMRPKEDGVYDLTTPLLDKFYRAARKRLRFPRYYKKALNW